jgi:hypothetical protein
MKTRLRRISWGVVFLLWLSAVFIAPIQASIYGPGGLLINPTADMPEKGALSPSALGMKQDGPGALGGRRTLASYSLTYGLSDNIELGINHLRLNPTGGAKADPSNGASVKWRFLRGKVDGRPDVVLGGNFLSGGDLDGQTAFLAARFATKINDGEATRGNTANLHLGLMYANDLWGFRRRELVPYAGVDIPLAKRLRAFAEIRQRMGIDSGAVGTPDVRAPRAAGLVWEPGGGLKIFLGVANNGQSRSTGPSIGIGYTVGVRRSSR